MFHNVCYFIMRSAPCQCGAAENRLCSLDSHGLPRYNSRKMIMGGVRVPPKIRYDREAVLQAAYRIARSQGAEAVNARAIARELGCSTQPIFRAFSGMEELRQELLGLARACYNSYMARSATLADKAALQGHRHGVYSLRPGGTASVPHAVYARPPAGGRRAGQRRRQPGACGAAYLLSHRD